MTRSHHTPPEAPPGPWPTGIGEVDHLAGGVHAGQLTWVTGPPRTGRSALVRNIAVSLARQGRSVTLLLLAREPSALERAELGCVRRCDRRSELLDAVYDASEAGVEVLVVDHLDRVRTDLRPALARLRAVAQQSHAAVVVGARGVPQGERAGDDVLRLDEHGLDDFGLSPGEVMLYRDPDPADAGAVILPRPRPLDRCDPSPASSAVPTLGRRAERSSAMQITIHDVYEAGQRIGWCARPLHDLGPFGHDEVHALVTDAAIEHVRLGERWLIPRAHIDDIPRIGELWRSRDVEWIDRSPLAALDEDDEDEGDELELVVHDRPRRLGPAEERAQIRDSQGRLLASAVRLPAGTEALLTQRVADVAPSGIRRRSLERIVRRRRVPGDWITIDRAAVAFLCEVIAVLRQGAR